MHVHASAMFGFTTFVMILLLMTLWGQIAAKIATKNPALAGAMMAQTSPA